MKQPDNHFARRADDRIAKGYTPPQAPAWPLVLITLLCWCILVCGFTLLGLPFVQWIVDHGRHVP